MTPIEKLRQAGAIRSGEPVKKVVHWTNDDGEAFEFEVWVKPVNFGAAADAHRDPSGDAIASTIAATVLFADENGKPTPVTAEEIRELHPGLGWAILKQINFRPEPPKNLMPTMSFSANSSSVESAAEPSQKPDSA